MGVAVGANVGDVGDVVAAVGALVVGTEVGVAVVVAGVGAIVVGVGAVVVGVGAEVGAVVVTGGSGSAVDVELDVVLAVVDDAIEIPVEDEAAKLVDDEAVVSCVSRGTGVDVLDVSVTTLCAVRMICSKAVDVDRFPSGERYPMTRYLCSDDTSNAMEGECAVQHAFNRTYSYENDKTYIKHVAIDVSSTLFSMLITYSRYEALIAAGVTYSTPATMSAGEIAKEAIKSAGGAGQVVLATNRSETGKVFVSVLLSRSTSSAPTWFGSCST